MIENPNDKCPVCENEDISYDSAIEPDGDIWKQKCSCPKCKSKWDNIYCMIEDGYSDIQTENRHVMICPNCNKAIDHVEVHAAFDRKARLIPPCKNDQEWTIQIPEEGETVNFEVEIITCPLCLESISFDHMHGEKTARIRKE